MFETRGLTTITFYYFNVIYASEYGVMIQSKNARQFLYLHNVTQSNKNACVIFHKHKASHLYHLNG